MRRDFTPEQKVLSIAGLSQKLVLGRQAYKTVIIIVFPASKSAAYDLWYIAPECDLGLCNTILEHLYHYECSKIVLQLQSPRLYPILCDFMRSA